MSNFRELAPRPPGAPPAPPEIPNVTRKTKISVACESCRVRRIKCDGARPRCRACSLHVSDCVYAMTPPVLAQQQKATIEGLEKDKSALYEILWYLQTESPEHATSLLDSLRTKQGDDIGAMLQHFAQYRDTAHGSIVSSSKNPIPSLSQHEAVPSATHRPNSLNLPVLLQARGLVHPDSVVSPSTRSRYATAQDLAGPIAWFLNCVGALFYIVSKDEAEESIQSINHISTPLGDIVAGNKDPSTTTLAAELAGMASVGVVHAQLADPAAAPPAELADYFYAVAKLGLDVAIEHSPLRAIKICALIAMYNIIVHATVALAYLDLGISLARRFGIDATEPSPTLSPAEYNDVSRTYRTLVHLQCWLSASLDYVPDAIGAAALTAAEDPNAPPEDMIRRECVKVSIIKAETLHRIPKFAPVPEDIVFHFNTRLQEFHNQLPSWMSLGQLIANPDNDLMTKFRPVIFYVHLFYLSAMMLLARRLMVAHIALNASGKVSLPSVTLRAIQDGFLAAQNNAQVLESMLSDGQIVQVCWLCIFTSYTAGVMIAYGAVQKAIHGLLFTSDMELAEKCIAVLSHCALRDTMAGRFRDVLNRELDGLRQIRESNSSQQGSFTTGGSLYDDFLFDFDDGSSSLHLTARRLLNLIHRPFSGLSDIATQSTLSNRAETTMGTHLEWEWELRGSKCLDDTTQRTAACAMSTTTNDEVQRLMLQPEGAAWSTWTPPVGT